jgi:hypothetical protein
MKAAATPILRSVLVILTSLLTPSCANLSALFGATGHATPLLINGYRARAFIAIWYGGGLFARRRRRRAMV